MKILCNWLTCTCTTDNYHKYLYSYSKCPYYEKLKLINIFFQACLKCSLHLQNIKHNETDKTSNKFKIKQNFQLMEKGVKGCMPIWVFRAWWYKEWYGLCEQYWAITSALLFSTSYFNYQTFRMWGWFQSRTKIKAVVNVQALWILFYKN